jgi:hypothetical protein
MSQAFQVSYLVYKGDSVEVLAEGSTVVNAASRLQAEDTVRAQFGYGNQVIIRNVFNA